MRLLLTGASSGLGKSLLPRLEASPEVTTVWCGSRRPARGSLKARSFVMDLSGPFELPPASVDLAVHVAGLVHSADPARYDSVNREGTIRFARAVRERDCRRMVYVSTRCVGPGSGAYGESKKAAEDALLAMDWERLLIIRPAEVYGAEGTEGVDAFIRAARRWRVAPMLLGGGIRFAPMHSDDFLRDATAAILAPTKGVQTLELRGPEELDGVELALRLSRLYGAVPVPVPVAVLDLIGRAARMAGFDLFAPDQIARLTGGKSCGPSDAPGLRRFPG